MANAVTSPLRGDIHKRLERLQNDGQRINDLAVQVGTIIGRIEILFEQPLELSSLPTLMKAFGAAWEKTKSIDQELTTIRNHFETIPPHVATNILQRLVLKQIELLQGSLNPSIFAPLQTKSVEMNALQQPLAHPIASSSSQAISPSDPLAQMKADLEKEVRALNGKQRGLFYEKYGQQIGNKTSLLEARNYGRQHYLNNPQAARMLLSTLFPVASSSSQVADVPGPDALAKIKADLKRKVLGLSPRQKASFFEKYGKEVGGKDTADEARSYGEEYYLENLETAQKILDKIYLKKEVSELSSGQKTSFFRTYGKEVGGKDAGEARNYGKLHYLENPEAARMILDKIKKIRRFRTSNL